MARINLIPPILLTDQHLMAEKREINLVASSFKRSFYSRKGILKVSIPNEFTLNAGHVKFFYNKAPYLNNRFDLICEELKKRKYSLEAPFYDIWSDLLIPQEFFIDYIPTKKDYKIIIERILSKVQLKDNWYRYYGKTINFNNYKNKLESFL